MNYQGNLRKIALLISFALLAMSTCLYAYLHAETSTLIGKTLAAREALRSAEATKLQGKDIVNLFEGTKDKRKSLRGLFVASENAVAVIQAIESVGDASGASVSISSIKSVPPTDKVRIGHVSAAVVISGAWQDVIRALTLFEDLPYDNSISNLALRYSGDGRRWQADFDLSVSTISKTL